VLRSTRRWASSTYRSITAITSAAVSGWVTTPQYATSLRVKRFTYGVWGEQQRNVRSHFVIDEEGKLSDVQVQVTPEESASTPATV
jgi:hypothetical protein